MNNDLINHSSGCEAPHGAIRGFDPYPGSVDGIYIKPYDLNYQNNNNIIKNTKADEAAPLAAVHAAPLGANLDAIRGAQYAPRASANEVVARAFRHAFGTSIMPRYGEPMAVSLKHGLVATPANESRWKSIDTNLGKMREYFDLFYYRIQHATAEQRHIFFVFCDALPVVIDRLLENNRKLDHVWIIALPFEFLGGSQQALNSALVSMPPRTPVMLASVNLQVELYQQLANIFRPLLTRKL